MAVEVKICGIRDEAALDAALDGGARLVGLVFYPPSPRHVDLATAARLAERARGRASVVALLVDPDDAEADEIARHLRPDMIQLHGQESPERVAALKARLALPVIKAVKVATARDAAEAERFRGVADIILFDAKPPATQPAAQEEGGDGDERRGGRDNGGQAPLPGGNGIPFDWDALVEARKAGPFMLSGGLTPENVAEAIRRTGAAMVDVSSGVERAPGEKDPDAIRRFLAAALG